MSSINISFVIHEVKCETHLPLKWNARSYVARDFLVVVKPAGMSPAFEVKIAGQYRIDWKARDLRLGRSSKSPPPTSVSPLSIGGIIHFFQRFLWGLNGGKMWKGFQFSKNIPVTRLLGSKQISDHLMSRIKLNTTAVVPELTEREP